MIVTCERCTTQFQLDDSRIPPGGVRVRCSRCKHAFEISPPRAEREAGELGDTLPDLPSDPPSGGMAWSADGEPEPAAEEPPVSSSGFAQRSALSTPIGSGFPDEDEESALLDDEPEGGSASLFGDRSAGVSLGGGPEEEESDWEFNEDPPPTGHPGAERETADAVDQFLRSPRSAPGGREASPGAGASEAASGLDLADARGAIASLREPAALAPPTPPAPRRRPPEEPGDEPGSGDDWDLFGGGEVEAPSVRTPDVRLPSPLASHDDEEREAPGWTRWASQAGGAAGWLAVAALFAWGLAGALPSPVPAQATGPVAIATSGALEVADTSGIWIDNAVAGPIYVIAGELRNAGASRVAAPALAVELLDDQGQLVADLPVPLQAPHSRRNLRELPPSDLLGQPPGTQRGIGPGESVPFEAVVGAMPRAAARYRVVDAPPSLRRVRPAPGPEAPDAPRRKRRDSAFEMIAEEAPPAPASEAGPDADASPPAAPEPGTPAAPAP